MRALTTQAIQYVYTRWEDTLLWVGDLKHGLEYQVFPPCGPALVLPSSILTSEIWRSGRRRPALECEQMKSRLLDLKDIEREDGRVGGTRSWPEPRPDLQKLRHT